MIIDTRVRCTFGVGLSFRCVDEEQALTLPAFYRNTRSLLMLEMLQTPLSIPNMGCSFADVLSRGTAELLSS